MEVRIRKIERKKKGNEGKPKFLEIRIENFWEVKNERTDTGSILPNRMRKFTHSHVVVKLQNTKREDLKEPKRKKTNRLPQSIRVIDFSLQQWKLGGHNIFNVIKRKLST